jgi:mannose-6-phosphate isomerase-like protein (cupin superfamily)
MQNLNRGSYTIARDEVVAEGADLRVSILTLAAGQCVPWRHHSNTSDRFFCMEGPMVVETHTPRTCLRASRVLKPGETCMVPPRIEHYLHGQDHGPCRFMLVQGVGVLDYVPAGG